MAIDANILFQAGRPTVQLEDPLNKLAQLGQNHFDAAATRAELAVQVQGIRQDGLLRAVPKHPGMALHAVLDKTHANLTLARLQVQRMDALFDEQPGA